MSYGIQLYSSEPVELIYLKRSLGIYLAVRTLWIVLSQLPRRWIVDYLWLVFGHLFRILDKLDKYLLPAWAQPLIPRYTSAPTPLMDSGGLFCPATPNKRFIYFLKKYKSWQIKVYSYVLRALDFTSYKDTLTKIGILVLALSKVHDIAKKKSKLVLLLYFITLWCKHLASYLWKFWRHERFLHNERADSWEGLVERELRLNCEMPVRFKDLYP